MTYRPYFLLPIVLLAPLIVVAQYEPPPWESVEVIPKAPKKNISNSDKVTVEYSGIDKVTVYVKSFCRKCDAVVSFLKERNIRFDKVYSYLTLTGIPGLILGDEEPPITVVEYSNGTSRKIVGYDDLILGSIFSSQTSGNGNDFGLSEFDLRGTKDLNRKDSFDLR